MRMAVELQAGMAFGLRIASEIPLPELPPAQANHPAGQDVDVFIGYEDLSDLWAELGNGRNNLAVREGIVMFDIAGTALFCIRDGSRISVCPRAGADAGSIRLYLLGTCMGALLLQRGTLPLHGSAVAIGGRAYAVIGESGAGKSTLAAAFLDRGFRMVTDDVIALRLAPGDAAPLVTPAYPQQKLWQESLEQFGMGTGGFRRLAGDMDKFAVPVAERFHADPLPLAGVFELSKGEQPGIELAECRGLAAIPLLTAHTYRQFLVSRMGLLPWQFDLLAAVAAAVPVYRLRRPAGAFTAHGLADLIIDTLPKGAD